MTLRASRYRAFSRRRAFCPSVVLRATYVHVNCWPAISFSQPVFKSSVDLLRLRLWRRNPAVAVQVGLDDLRPFPGSTVHEIDHRRKQDSG